jgi:LmbE family N-acetylglucosaminyl deacetylase
VRRFALVTATVVGLVMVAWLLLVWGARRLLHDADIPQRSALVPAAPPRRIMTFFAHPDDEVAVAGTLLGLAAVGHEIHLVCLTRGGAGKSRGITDPAEMARLRTHEMERSAAIIGARQLHLFDYADGGLATLGMDSLQAIAAQLVRDIRPDVVLTMDSKIGLYGHPDHRLASLAMERFLLGDTALREPAPMQLFQVTLSPKQVRLVLQLSDAFRRAYPATPGAGLPVPDFSVRTHPYFTRVLDVIAAHGTQRWAFRERLPFYDRVPPVLYSRLFDREYFHEVTREPRDTHDP